MSLPDKILVCKVWEERSELVVSVKDHCAVCKCEVAVSRANYPRCIRERFEFYCLLCAASQTNDFSKEKCEIAGSMINGQHFEDMFGAKALAALKIEMADKDKQEN